MAPATRELWAVLGWSSSNWTNGPNPASDSFDWEELSEEEQQAASMLGYSEETWDDDDSGNPFGQSVHSDKAGWYDNPMVPLSGFFGLALLLWWWDEQEWKQVGLTSAQRDELRELVTGLDQPQPIVAGPGRYTWFRSAQPREKTDVANDYLRTLLHEFHTLSGGKDHITRQRWEELERSTEEERRAALQSQGRASSRDGTSRIDYSTSAVRAVCGAVFSQGGRGMRLAPSSASATTSAAASAASSTDGGGLSFRAFATLCTLLASSSQGDVASQARLVFFLADEDADGYISRTELRNFVATCLDANLLRPKAFHKQLLAKFASTHESAFRSLGLRGDPGYAPPQWCFDQAEALTEDIMQQADTNFDGVLDETEFMAEVAPLIYAEMRAQGFAPPAPTHRALQQPGFNELLEQLIGSCGERTVFADYEETDDADHELVGFLRALEREDRRRQRDEKPMIGAYSTPHVHEGVVAAAVA